MIETETTVGTSLESDQTGSSARRPVYLLAAIIGGFIVFLSVCGLVAYLILPLQGGRDTLTNNTLIGSLVTMGFVFGIILLVTGIATARGHKIPPLHLPTPWLFLGIFFIVIGVGQAVLLANVAAAYLFPPWHVLASAMLPVAVLAYAVRRLPPVPGPSGSFEFVWGGLGTFILGLVFELIAGAFVALVAFALLYVLVGPDSLQALIHQIVSTPIDLSNPDRIISLFASQPAVLVIASTSAIAFFVFIAPFIEEMLKAAGPAVLIARAKPLAATALLWGLAAGAGFAFSENLLNGASGATPQPGTAPIWAPAMTIRAGTSLIHMGATATVSLGWYLALVKQRRFYFIVLFLIAWLAHGLWNMIALVLTVALTGISVSRGSDLNSSTLNAAAGIVSLLVFATLILLAALWIRWLVRWAIRQDHQVPPNDPSAQVIHAPAPGLGA